MVCKFCSFARLAVFSSLAFLTYFLRIWIFVLSIIFSVGGEGGYVPVCEFRVHFELGDGVLWRLLLLFPVCVGLGCLGVWAFLLSLGVLGVFQVFLDG
jgi:hypothetical protein